MKRVAAVLRSDLVLLAIFCALPLVSKAFSQGSSGDVNFVNFEFDEFFYLNISNLGSELVEYGDQCGFACLEIPSCISYNLAAIPDINGLKLCELLPSDKYNSSDKFASNKLFHHLSMPSPCSSGPCKNNGTCVTQYDKEKSYVCVCKEGFTGKNCETDINECDSNPCVNNGICNDRVNGFNCSCSPGFTGSRCEKDINECGSNPCLNNGTCNDGVNEFNCSCPPGFSGDLCETDIDECGSNPCLNNGTCIDGVNGFTCNCTREFDGDRCEIDLSINSTILAAFLAPAVGNDPKWLLCYRASIHGWAASTFHSRCDGKRHTVTIIRKGPYVFGGYTDIPWDGSSSYTRTSNAFIFSLRNKEGLPPFKSMVVKPQYAIVRHSNYGPTFGDGHDIYISDNANTNGNSYSDFGQHGGYTVPSGVKDRYTILAGTRNFSPDDWEVFYRQ